MADPITDEVFAKVLVHPVVYRHGNLNPHDPRSEMYVGVRCTVKPMADVFPDNIDVEFGSIGGMEEIKETLFEELILPSKRLDLFNHGKLLGP